MDILLRHFCKTAMSISFLFSSTSFGMCQQNPAKIFDNSIAPLPPPTTPGANSVEAPTPETLNRVLHLHFSIQGQNVDKLDQIIASGGTVTGTELNTTYAGPNDAVARLVGWLQEAGFKDIEVTPDKTSVYASATAAQVQEAMKVKMESVEINGSRVITATSPPIVPQAVFKDVNGIDGLQPWQQVKSNALGQDEYNQILSLFKKHHVHVTPQPQTTGDTPFTISDITKAYKAEGLGFTGKGETIAILIDSFPYMADLQSFWKINHIKISANQIKFVTISGIHATSRFDKESSLDAEWAGGVAPGATVAIYASGTLQYQDIDRALQQIVEDAGKPNGPRQVSISLGLREDRVTPAEIAIEDSYFRRLAALGVTTFVSSGDAGSNPDLNDEPQGPSPIVEYEASGPYVVSVGGTSLSMQNGKVAQEVGWAGSGGGVSAIEPRPIWQPAYSLIHTNMRLVPDVSSDADPRPGAMVIVGGKDYPQGGTSWGTPVWAAFCALINSARSQKGLEPLGFLAPHLYSPDVQATFTQITSGSNGFYSAGPGWNPVTGLGVANVNGLAAELIK